VRVVVVGATGNVGTALLEALRADSRISAVAGVARRLPDGYGPYAGVRWHSVDVAAGDAVAALTPVFAGADAVVHLAWQIQPSHDRARLRATNVGGARHVAEAVLRAGVPALVVASSIGAYAPGPKEPPVSEDWPVTGVPGASYSVDKAAVERMLDQLEHDAPQLRVVRLRPGLIFQATAAAEIARFFAGPLAPVGLLRFGRVPVIPAGPRLRLQAVHADDVARAYLAAVTGNVRGAFNIAAEPVLDAGSVAPLLHGRGVPVPPWLLRAAAAVSWRMRLQPVEPGWVTLAARSPLMSLRRAREELGWQARVDARDALAELLAAMSRGNGGSSAPLRRRESTLRALAGGLRGRPPGHGDPY
jgi:UDP-glucose 4-epimerase